MGLDPDTVQQQVQRQAMQAFDQDMAQGDYYEGLRLGGELSQMRMDVLEDNALEKLCLLLPEQNQLVLWGGYNAEDGWRQIDAEIPLTPADTPVLTDTYDGVQVQLEGTQGTITLSPAPKTATWDTELNFRLEQAHTYPILGSYNEYVDVCIGQQTDSVFHPVVYLLAKDGVVEYVDVLRCLLFGNAMICQDPIYIANNGTALGFSLARDTENGPECVAFSAALQYDYSIDCLILIPLSGQNPLTNETVPLVLTHSYG